MSGRRWRLNFRRLLNEHLESQPVDLESRLTGVPLNEEKDRTNWKWPNSEIFSVKPVYNTLLAVVLVDCLNICGK